VFELTAGGLRVRRRVRAPRADVYDAWVNPERLRAWWGPPGFTVERIDADLRVGGRYRIVMQPPEGDARELLSTFEEITPPERLVYEWQWVIAGVEQPVTRVSVTFRDAGGVTEVELVHRGFTDDAERRHHIEGWDGCFQRLAAGSSRTSSRSSRAGPTAARRSA
jgi:uncharacterized protein YndB with AHSA1/START domain